MKTISLYNNDGTLSTEAQFLLAPKPADMSIDEWKKTSKEFRSQLSKEDVKEFDRLKINALQRVYRHKNKEEKKAYEKVYRQKNKEQINACQRACRQKNKEKANACSRAYHHKNKEERNAKSRAYYYNNKEERKARMTEYARARRQKDPLYNFFHSIRSQAVRVVKQVGLGKKPTNTFKWVGCSPEQLKAHIESLFLEGMTWDNYGKYGWHVDHIRPVSSFKPEEWEQINHYTNLQPLWAKDNLSKGDKFNQK